MFFSSPNIFVDGICFPTRFEICLILFHGISWWNLVSQTLQTATSKLRRHMQTMREKERAIWRNNVNTNTKHNKHIHILTDIFEDITNIIYIYIQNGFGKKNGLPYHSVYGSPTFCCFFHMCEFHEMFWAILQLPCWNSGFCDFLYWLYFSPAVSHWNFHMCEFHACYGLKLWDQTV